MHSDRLGDLYFSKCTCAIWVCEKMVGLKPNLLNRLLQTYKCTLMAVVHSYNAYTYTVHTPGESLLLSTAARAQNSTASLTLQRDKPQPGMFISL